MFWALPAWVMSGVGTIDHAVPFQCADKVADPPVSSVPTAHTSPGLTAVIAVANCDDISGVGEVAAVQVVPFQCSNSNWIVSVASLLSQPAAHRSPGPVPEIEVSTSASPGMPVAGSGLGTIDHRVPFQCSIRAGPSWGDAAPPLKLVPTAQAFPGPRSSTAFSRACCPAGCGTGTRVQVPPDRCSASGWSRAFWSMKVPTAHASPGPVADTLPSVLLVGSGAMPCGLTVASTFQTGPAAAPPGPADVAPAWAAPAVAVGPPAAADAGWVTPAETSAAAATAAAAMMRFGTMKVPPVRPLTTPYACEPGSRGHAPG